MIKAHATYSRIQYLIKIDKSFREKMQYGLSYKKVLADIFNPYEEIILNKNNVNRHTPERKYGKLDRLPHPITIYRGKYNTLINVFSTTESIHTDNERWIMRNIHECWSMNNATEEQEPLCIMNKNVPFAYLASNDKHDEIIVVPSVTIVPNSERKQPCYYVERKKIWLAEKEYTDEQKKEIVSKISHANLNNPFENEQLTKQLLQIESI